MLIDPCVTPLRYVLPRQSHGLVEDAEVVMLSAKPRAVQLLNAADVILPSGFFWPVPLFSVAPRDDDVHVVADCRDVRKHPDDR